ATRPALAISPQKPLLTRDGPPLGPWPGLSVAGGCVDGGPVGRPAGRSGSFDRTVSGPGPAAVAGAGGDDGGRTGGRAARNRRGRAAGSAPPRCRLRSTGAAVPAARGRAGRVEFSRRSAGAVVARGDAGRAGAVAATGP